MKNYEVPTWAKWMVYTFTAGLVIGSIVLGYYACQDSEARKVALIAIPIMLTIAGACIIGMRNWRLSVTEDSLIYCAFIKTKEVSLKDITGYRLDDKYAVVETSDPKVKSMRISIGIKDKEEFLAWLATNYPDLNAQDYAREEEEIMVDETFGADEEERAVNLARARKVASTLSTIGGGLMLWGFIYPRPYELVLGLSLLLPLVALGFYRVYGGQLRLTTGEKSAYPSLAGAFAPALLLLLRALIDFDIWEYKMLFISTALIALLAVVVIIADPRKVYKVEPSFNALLMGIVAVGLLYGYGASVLANCYLDNAPGQTYATEVLDKRISSGKHTTYYLKVAPWGPQLKADEITVDSDFYEGVPVGSQIHVTLKPGRLGAPWYVVSL
ncbi:MAG: hypothetical protein JST76_12795 [Bacteroidetes bacterium]|nr:hypothetical protein [Bacteroidota bacterium]